MIAREPMLILEVEVAAPVSIGTVDGVETRLVPIVGGTVTGRHTGRVLAGGADWQAVQPSGDLEIRARYLLELEEGLVEIRSEGIRHGTSEVLARLAKGEAVPAHDYYFRTFVRFRTAAPEVAYLNSLLAISAGERLPDRVRLQVYEVS